MNDTEKFIRSVYRMADAEILNVEGWCNAFTADGVFSVAAAMTKRSGAPNSAGQSP